MRRARPQKSTPKVPAGSHGRESIWELETRQLEEARRCLDLISQQWDQSLGRLKMLVEGPEDS